MDLTAVNLRPPRLTRQGISWVSALTISKQRSTETQVVRETIGRIEVNLSGLREVLNENLSLGTRLLWLLVFTAAVLICFYQSSEVIANVYEDPSITNFRYVHNQSIEFPTVVICPCELNDDFSVVKDPVLNAAFLKERFGNASAYEVLNSLQFGTLKLSELWNIYKLNITHISVLTSDNSEEVVTKIGSYSESFMISEVYTSLGNCVHLRLKNNLKLYQSGSFFKLKLSGDFPFAVVAFHQEDDLPIEKYLYRRTATVVKRKSLETQYLRVTQVSIVLLIQEKRTPHENISFIHAGEKEEMLQSAVVLARGAVGSVARILEHHFQKEGELFMGIPKNRTKGDNRCEGYLYSSPRPRRVINRNTRKRPCCTGPTVSNCLAQCFINKFAAKETNLLCRCEAYNVDPRGIRQNWIVDPDCPNPPENYSIATNAFLSVPDAAHWIYLLINFPKCYGHS